MNNTRKNHFFFKRNAIKKAQKVRLYGATAWVLPNPGTFFLTWICYWIL